MKWSSENNYRDIAMNNHTQQPKYIQISEREREKLYEECWGDIPYIGYHNWEEIKKRQQLEYEKYIKTKNRKSF
jgi:hypothetical protein